jgi:hypothetical protein
MRRKLVIAFVSVLLFSATALCIQHFWRGKTMSVSEAEKRWGAIPFDAAKFKDADLKTRASMAASLKKKEQDFKGKNVEEIRKELGPTSGFYFSDVYPTYLIQTGKTNKEETWQIVFLLNKERRAESIIIHKNCCD